LSKTHTSTSKSGEATSPTNPRGIPYAPFIDRVEDYVTSSADVEGTLKNFQEMISYVSQSPVAGESPAVLHEGKSPVRRRANRG